MLYMGSLIGGLLSYDKNNNKYTYHTNPSLPVESKNIYDIKEDGNTLWLATWAGLCSFNKISLITKLYTKPDDVKYQKLYALSIIGDKIFTCGEYGMACYNKKTNQWTAVPDSSGYLVKNKVIGRYMSSISDDELGIATTDNNFIIYNIQRGRFKEFSDLKRISVSARHFYKDNQGLWIATDRGLILFNLEKERVVKIWDKSSGLIDDFIYAVSRDSSGNTWFSHNHGVSKLNKDFGQIVNYSLNDGLQDLEFNTASCFKSPNGRIYFGGINGVNEVTGMSEATKNPIKRPLVNKVQILNLDLNSDTSAQYLSNVILKHNQNYISFEYISPNLTSSQGLGYEYILSNFDENWIKAGSRTYVSYTGLTPGTYTFRVRTYDPYGNNSEISNPIRIKITKPFYKHTLFYLLAAFLTFIVFSYYINSRISTIKKRHLTNVKLAKFELNALHSQINSHFIFNSMNSISHMIHDNDNKNAILYLNKFAKLLRSRIEDSKSTFVTLQSEIETVRQYIEIEKLRLENLTFYTSIDTQIDINNTLVPPFVIQPLVEDIIWYKLAGHQGPRELAIHVFSHKNKVVLEIEDSANQVLGYKNELEDHIIKLKAILDRIILFNKKHDTLFELNVIHDPDNMKNTKIKFTINTRS
jgi:hypothetical protein